MSLIQYALLSGFSYLANLGKSVLLSSMCTLVLFLILIAPLGTTLTMAETMAEENILKNVLGEGLQSCCTNPITGYFRDGYCRTAAHDRGTHVVCAEMTAEFLEYTKSKGNDLITPNPDYNFPGLKPGDKWCLCAIRWSEALRAGVAPKVVLESTDEKALEFVDLEVLKANASNVFRE